ncbi:PKD domain-containing protein [Candidatus Bipolaricaulota bacterium]|nr:PKD domain-containing protein [Candidatus Bipolaricaulota bacterium]
MRRLQRLTMVLVMSGVLAALYGCTLLNSVPIASFDVTPTTGPAPLVVQVNAGTSLDPDGDSLTFSWDFGDGTFGAGATGSHTYLATGQYAITLTATDFQGQQSSAVQTIWVIEASDLPEASFTASPSSGGTPLTVSFNAAASGVANGSIVSYTWSYGDGSTGSGVSVIHSYAFEGTYTATLTVTDDQGFSDTMSLLIVVISGGQGGCS